MQLGLRITALIQSGNATPPGQLQVTGWTRDPVLLTRQDGRPARGLLEKVPTALKMRPTNWEFPGGPVVGTPRFHCREPGFNPCLGNEDPGSCLARPKKKKKNEIHKEGQFIASAARE